MNWIVQFVFLLVLIKMLNAEQTIFSGVVIALFFIWLIVGGVLMSMIHSNLREIQKEFKKAQKKKKFKQ